MPHLNSQFTSQRLRSLHRTTDTLLWFHQQHQSADVK